jgi:multiple sugar transport system ATP-binding protein
MSEIQLRGIHKRFGDVQVLADIDLSIAHGEFCVFIGPSGCGKSTLLRLIAGLDDPSGGDILIGGQRVNDLPPAGRDVAMVFQSYALYPHMTVYENMAFGLRHLKLDSAEIDRRVRVAAESLHLATMMDRKPVALSGGQRQRVAIGRAIVRQPKVFLFDEPLSNLDAALRVKTRVEIARLHREVGGASMVYVTHDQVEAMTLANKIVLLRPLAGQSGLPSIAQVGHPLELYHRPANRFVAAFIGSPSMNFIDGEVVSADAAGVAVAAGGKPIEASVDGAGARPGQPVTLGIRPEHILVGEGERFAEVSHVEQLGEHAYLYLTNELSAQPLVAKVGASHARIGERVPYSLPARGLHLFAENGEAFPRKEIADFPM